MCGCVCAHAHVVSDVIINKVLALVFFQLDDWGNGTKTTAAKYVATSLSLTYVNTLSWPQIFILYPVPTTLLRSVVFLPISFHRWNTHFSQTTSYYTTRTRGINARLINVFLAQHPKLTQPQLTRILQLKLSPRFALLIISIFSVICYVFLFTWVRIQIFKPDNEFLTSE